MANVIVVDDDQAIRTLIKRIVEHEGHTVREAADGRVALELMRQSAADLIISDVYMPEMDGIETLIRMQQEFPGTRIIVMSGGGHMNATGVLDIATTLGARASLQKPMSDKEVRAAIAKALA